MKHFLFYIGESIKENWNASALSNYGAKTFTYGDVASFIKSGAALSYVIRDGSIFRLRSKTAPIGLLSTVDSERIRVEVRSGDYVVMMSDGVCQSDEESAWLLELLSRPIRSGVRGLADLIIAEARGGVSARDDMSVLVMRISDAAQ